MPWTSLLFLFPLLSIQDDVPPLRRRLEEASLSRKDKPPLKELTERVSRSRDAVYRGIDFLRKTAAPGRESALTPFALFALLRAGVPVDDPVIQKGFRALLQNPGAPHGAGPLACAQYGIRARLLVMMRQTPSGAWIDGGSAIDSTAAALLFLSDDPPVPTADSRPARPVSDRFEKAAARIRLPDAKARETWAGKSEHYRRVVGTLSDPANWAWALQAIEDRLGLFFPEGEVEIAFEELEDRRPARGGGRDGKGIVKFNLRRLAEYAREVEQARKRATGIPVWVVPPASLEALITHELAHVATGPCEEKWLAEGLATYAASDPHFLFAFNDRAGRVEPLDRPVAEEDGYARGWAFLEWLRERHGAEKVRELAGFVRNEGAALAEAAPAVTGKTWEEVVKEEHAWSREFLSRFRPSR